MLGLPNKMRVIGVVAATSGLRISDVLDLKCGRDSQFSPSQPADCLLVHLTHNLFQF
jgi:hypothetical protein